MSELPSKDKSNPNAETWEECVRLRAEVKKLERDLEKVMIERDEAEDALQTAHIALGGDGEWAGRLPPQDAPDSGDLRLDVPALAAERMAEIERLQRSNALLLELQKAMEDCIGVEEGQTFEARAEELIMTEVMQQNAQSAHEPPDVIPEVEAVWDLVVRACQSAWPGEKRGYGQSPIELIVDLINERDEALRSAQPPEAWQPIATAPRNGTRILLAANVHAPDGRPRISSGHYSTDPYIGGANDDVIGADEGFKGDQDECIPSNQECFTHWAPIPAFSLTKGEGQ